MWSIWSELFQIVSLQDGLGSTEFRDVKKQKHSHGFKSTKYLLILEINRMNQKKVSFSKFFESNKSAFFKSQVNKFTEKKYFRRILIVIKTFPGFPSLGVQNCFVFKVK